MKKQLSVERLLQWAYGVELVRGAPSWGEAGRAGTTGRAGKCHHDALTVDQIVGQLSPETAAVIRDHAVAGSQPDWRDGARHRMVPLRWDWDGDVRFAVLFDTHPVSCACGGFGHACKLPIERRPRWPRGERPEAYNPMIDVDRPDDVCQQRERFYLPWWCGLQVIRNALRTRVTLVAHSVTDELPPRFPWLTKKPVDGEIRAM